MPTSITYDYVDVDGNLQTQAPVELFNIQDPKCALSPSPCGASSIAVDYFYCGDPSASPTNCFDAATNTAILEIPAGASVTFGAFQYQPLATPPTSGSVKAELDSVQAMINRITGSNGGRDIKIGEIASRNTGGAFSAGGGILPKLVLDWAGIDPSAPDYVDPAPTDYKLVVGAGHSLSAPPGWAAAWDSKLERWYFPSGTLDGQAEDVVRLIGNHMNSAGDKEFWIAHESRAGNLGRLHIWAMLGGYMQLAPGAKIGLPAGGGVSSTWNFDIPPTVNAEPIPTGYAHASFNGRNDKGVGFPTSGVVNENDFTKTYTYETPSEPGGYMVRSDLNLIWAYGTEIGGPAWKWYTGLFYAGYVNLEPAGVALTSPEGIEFIKNLDSIRSQLRCLSTDVDPTANIHGCKWDPYFDILDLASVKGDVEGGNTESLLRLMGLNSTQAAAATTDVANLNLPPPAIAAPPAALPGGVSVKEFSFSGRFPQTTRGNGGTPGKAYIIVRDVLPPAHVKIEDAQNSPADSAVLGSGSEEGVILGGETGRLLKDSLGTKTKLDVVVFDDNPGQIVFGLRNGAAMLNQSGGDVSGALSGFSATVTDDTLVTPPKVQVWYAVQKAGYDFQAGAHARVGAESMSNADLDDRAVIRLGQLGGDSYLVPDPTFRFYPFREAGASGIPGAIKEYEPYEYQLVEQDGESMGVVMRFEIDLADMREPLGLHFAEGSEQKDDGSPPIDYPAYSQFMNRLFVRVADGRLLSTAGAVSIVPTPSDAKWAGFLQGNFSPYFDETVEHEPGFLQATQVFPDDREVTKDLTTTDVLVPPTYPAALAARASGAGFPDTALVEKAFGIQVKDVIPPTVLLMVKDTKYDRTAFFGNPFLGDMSQKLLQEVLISGDVLDTSLQEMVPSDLSSSDDRAREVSGGVRLYPSEGAEVSIPYCPPTGGNDCLVPPDTTGGKTWTFTFDRGGTNLADYQTQLELQTNTAFNPSNFFASSQILTATCDSNGLAPDCRASEPDGFWVDEDTRLVFRVLVRDNLNAYTTTSATSDVDGFQNIEISGASSPSIGTLGTNIVDVRLVDELSGYAAPGMRLSDGASNELQDSWPTYSFRNPNRIDNGGGITALSEEAYVEVEYTDLAGNKSVLHVDMFVVENTMRILSLREERQRELD
jgi:hypothetical protein